MAYVTPEHLCDDVERLVSAATPCAITRDGETFLCLICGLAEDHTETCFIPTLLLWQRTVNAEPKVQAKR